MSIRGQRFVAALLLGAFIIMLPLAVWLATGGAWSEEARGMVTFGAFLTAMGATFVALLPEDW